MKKCFVFLMLITSNFLLEARLFNINNNSQYNVTISPDHDPRNPAAVVITPKTVLARKDIPCSKNLTITTSDVFKTPSAYSPSKDEQGFSIDNPQILSVDCMDFRILDIWINDAKYGVVAVTTLENRTVVRAMKKSPEEQKPAAK